MVTLIRVLDETYFLALAMEPGGNQGKGRYLMRVSAPKLAAELVCGTRQDALPIPVRATRIGRRGLTRWNARLASKA